MRRFQQITLILLSSLSLAGCASTSPPQTSDGINTERVAQNLRESTSAMAESLRILYELKNGRAYLSMTPDEMSRQREIALNLPESLKVPITVDHHGDAEALIRLIGRLVRYEVEEPFGRVPHDRPIVRINAKARPAYDVLRDIGAQVNRRMEIDVMPADNPNDRVRGVIVLRYL